MKTTKPSLINRLLCHLCLCSGHMEHERDANGIWWVGLRCTSTGKLHDPVKSLHQESARLDSPGKGEGK